MLCNIWEIPIAYICAKFLYFILDILSNNQNQNVKRNTWLNEKQDTGKLLCILIKNVLQEY